MKECRIVAMSSVFRVLVTIQILASSQAHRARRLQVKVH